MRYHSPPALTIDLPEQYIGRLLYLEPSGQPDWKQWNAPHSSVEMAHPQTGGGFSVRVRYFLTLHAANVWCGLVGRVEQEGHLFDRLWIGCSVNYQGYPDFTDYLRRSWCRLGPYRPTEPAFYIPAGLPFYEGQGILAESKVTIAEVLEAKSLFG